MPPPDADPGALDREIRDELRSLPRGVADRVARHLVAAGQLLDEDPAQALAQALAARRLAARVPAVREAVGLAAYRAGDWQTAMAELRTYHRMSGRHTHLAAIADCERALGRPQRALDLHRTTPELPTVERIELLIVAAGARLDLGQPNAALAMLTVPEREREDTVGARLRYAYAEALLAADRREEAREWFVRAAQADTEEVTDAAERVLELDGVVITSVDDQETGFDDPMPDGVPDGAAPDTGGPADPTGPDLAADPVEEAPAEGAPTDDPAPGDASPRPATPTPTTPPPAATTARLVDGYDLVVLDLDGVVYVGEQAVPGAVEAVTRLRSEGVPVAYATNNASRSREEVAQLLQRLGIPAEPAEVVTSTMIAGETLAAQLPPGAPVLVIGSAALAAEIRDNGLTVVTTAEPVPAAVVQGYAPDVGWPQLAEASLAVRAGAWWVATNTDLTLPSPRGPLPGNGALVAAVQAAVGRGPDLVVGKPDPGFFATVAARFGARRPLVVGDRLDTDVAGARAAGMDSLLVLTGVTSRDQVDLRPPDQRPTYVAPDLTALLAPPSGVA